MRLLLYTVLMAGLVLASLNPVHAQAPTGGDESRSAPNPRPASPPCDLSSNSAMRSAAAELELCRREVTMLQSQQSAERSPATDDRQQRRLELLQRQVETLQKMVMLLSEQVRRQPAAAAPAPRLETQVATLEARGRQAARRDQELAGAIDRLTEQMDAEQRSGPRLPATLKELFLPSQTNETPLSIYGTFTANYHKMQGQPGTFEIEEFSPLFLLQLNERFLLEAEVTFDPSGASLSLANINWFVNDWMTVTGGRFFAPFGFFNGRLDAGWINKFPDNPLMFRQVSPSDFKPVGIELRGAHYLGCSPVKMEYGAWVGNGLGLKADKPMLSDVANIQSFDTFEEIHEDSLAVGGRLGFWIPEYGVNFGVSGYRNGAYTAKAEDELSIWSTDASYHKGNWDLRLEYAQMFQEARSFIGHDINRRGLYAQAAYRAWDACPKFLQNLEFAFRYSFANFTGIDPTKLDFTTFDTPVDIPVNRNQYTLGINYYFYPSLVLKTAYEINSEKESLKIRDNVFYVQLSWGF